MTADGAAVVACARTWLGTKFVHQAALKGVGCDCRGLLLGVANELGIEGASSAAIDQACNNYARQPDGDSLQRMCERYLDSIPRAAAAPGDVLLMLFKSAKPRHLAIITSLDPFSIIHSYAVARRVTEHSVDDVWRSRIVAAYRFRQWQA